jgi:hypothetical protein
MQVTFSHADPGDQLARIVESVGRSVLASTAVLFDETLLKIIQTLLQNIAHLRLLN